jgi:DNA-binding GntR family transcriptional regulator
MAARRAASHERSRMLAMAVALEKAGNMGDVFAYLRSLFVANAFLAHCSRNSYAAEAIAPLHTLSRRFYFVHHLELNDVKVAGELHADVTRAVAAGDERAAGLHVERLMDYVEQFTRELITGHLDHEPAADTGGISSAQPARLARTGRNRRYARS